MARGKLIVIAAPSGSGKTTIAQEVMRRHPSLGFSVSATTRQRRANERDGTDYFFLSAGEFKKRVAAGDFVEWEEVFGHCYGTLKSEVDRLIAAGKDTLFDVDVKGALSIKRLYPEALLIFIKPPSLEVLRERLLGRRSENDDSVARRLERVPMEMEAGKLFDVQVVNDNLDRAVEEVDKKVREYVQQ